MYRGKNIHDLSPEFFSKPAVGLRMIPLRDMVCRLKLFSQASATASVGNLYRISEPPVVSTTQ